MYAVFPSCLLAPDRFLRGLDCNWSTSWPNWHRPGAGASCRHYEFPDDFQFFFLVARQAGLPGVHTLISPLAALSRGGLLHY